MFHQNTNQKFISPLVWVLLGAFFVRLIAVIFSKGYLTHDDHFIPIEQAYQWLSGQTEFFADKSGAWRNQLYALLHYTILASLESLSLADPQKQMFVVRLLHAIYSMLTIVYGYKLTKYLTHKEKTALLVAALLSFFWVMPVFSVHSFVETACIPPLLIAFYYSHKIESENYNRLYLCLAAFFFALAFTLRFQTFVFGVGVGLVLLFQKQFKKAFVLLGCTFFSLFITMGILDWIAYGYPFASIIQYSLYNLGSHPSYVLAPWYEYLVLLLVVFIFPTSLVFASGIAKIAKKHSLPILSLFLFILLHSAFANKQERFILPSVPFILIFGTIGWQELRQTARFEKLKKILSKCLWSWFWLWNILLLCLGFFYYGQETLIKIFDYLHSKQDIKAVVIENNLKEVPHLPTYYLYQNKLVYSLESETFTEKIETIKNSRPNYFILLEDEQLTERVKRLEKRFAIKLQLEKTIQAESFINKQFSQFIRNHYHEAFIYKKQ